MKTQTELYGMDRDWVAYLRAELADAGQTERQIERSLRTFRALEIEMDLSNAEAEMRGEEERAREAAAGRERRGRGGKPRYERD